MLTRAGGKRVRFEGLLSAYLEELEAQGASRALIERAWLVLPRLFQHLRRQRVRDTRSVRELHLIRFARYLSEAPSRHGPEGATLSLVAQSCYLQAVRGFFDWLVRSRVLLENPAQDLPAPKTLRLPRRVLTEVEARRLMDAPSASSFLGRRDRALLEVLYGTGLRRGECLRLDVADVDLGQELLLVRNGKGKKDRMVPLTARAVSALDLYLREGRPELVKAPGELALFLSKWGRRISRSLLSVLLSQHANTAGIQGAVFPHALRHAYATHLLKGKASIRHVQELLGHKSLEATSVYTRVSIEDLREVLARCHPRDRSTRKAVHLLRSR